MEPSPEAVEALFQQAIDLDPEQRSAFLNERCNGDADLRAAVEELLHFDLEAQRAPDFLPSPAADVLANLPTAEAVPGSVGRYRVVRRLGEGGMGTVYEAEQDDPPRTVALKVMRLGLDSAELRKRFAQESRILGRLHHAGIAQVYDAGATEDGRLYFAMEFIRGLPLGQYSRFRGLTAPARLELIARVCDAVRHAHEQGIIHRDLKPANILVEDSGQPKVLDFGVALATGGGLLGTSAHTRTGQMIGTLGYMSPEQVAGDPRTIDARSDVYALGVILYELLADRLPYQLDHLAIPEVVRVIQEVEPSRLGLVNRQFRGEIETIVAKAMDKDKGRRYSSAGELGEDLRRHLAREPILARPASSLYKVRKFVRRHKVLVSGASSVFAALLVATVISLLSARDARQSARAAIEEKQESQFQTYRARIAAAVAALAGHDVADAARHLDAAPEDLRDWEWRHLRSRLDDSSAVIPLPAGGAGLLLGGSDPLRAVAMTPAGLRLTNLENGEHKTLPIGPDRRAFITATQTRRGVRIMAWDGKTTVDLLDENGEVLCRVEVPQNTKPGRVSPDGTRLACSVPDGEQRHLALFDTISGKQTAVCDGHRNFIWAFTFSPDSTRLASVGEDELARVWDPATGALLATCRGHTSKVTGVAFSPDGMRLATTSADGTVRQWDAATGGEVEAPYDRHSGEVAAVTYSPDGQWVASAGTDRTIRVWRATGRQDVAVLHGHTGVVVGVAFAVSGRQLASLSGESLLGTGDDTVRVWDMDPQAPLPVLRGHTSYVYPVAFSPDGRWLASGGWDKTVRLWDAVTGEPCATLPHPGNVRSLAFGPDGTWLMTESDGDDRLRIWDMATVRVRKEIQGPGGPVWHLAVSPDGARVAASGKEAQRKGPLSVCDVNSGERLFSADGRALAYSHDGRWLAVRDSDEKIVVLLDARTHEVAARLIGHDAEVQGATFSPDSRLLASYGMDRTVRLWPIDGGACRVLSGHTDEIFAAAFHPDGTRLATAGRDRAIWLWDLARGEDVARLPGHTSYVWSLAFSRDGSTLASGSGDFTVRLWDTVPLNARHQARREVDAVRPEAARLVERLSTKLGVPGRVVARLGEDRSLNDPLRRAALQAVMSQASR